MKLTVITEDSRVGVDGLYLPLDLSQFNLEGVHAIQWEGTKGHIEYSDVSRPNDVLEDITQYLPIVNAHAAERRRIQDIIDAYEPSYREKRADAYARELSPEGTTLNAIGDTLDAILSHLAGDSMKLNTLLPKIQDIKARYPKP